MLLLGNGLIMPRRGRPEKFVCGNDTLRPGQRRVGKERFVGSATIVFTPTLTLLSRSPSTVSETGVKESGVSTQIAAKEREVVLVEDAATPEIALHV
jgi:hypothetical protein